MLNDYCHTGSGIDICLKNASKEKVIYALQNEFNVGEQDAEKIIDFIEFVEPSPKLITTRIELPALPPGAIGFMVTSKKYNINISKIAISAIMYILGIIPIYGQIAGLSNLMKDVEESIICWNDKEEAMMQLLYELSHSCREDIAILDIYKALQKNIFDEGLKEEIDRILDSLDEKGIIKIKMNKIKVIESRINLRNSSRDN